MDVALIDRAAVGEALCLVEHAHHGTHNVQLTVWFQVATVAEPRRWRQWWQQRRGWSSAGGVAAADGDLSSAVDLQELVLAVDDGPHGEL